MKFGTVINIDPKNIVLCDFCDRDWTDSDEQGGFYFNPKRYVQIAQIK